MSYTIKEISDDLGINQKTCLRWINNGMKTVSGCRRPILIMGYDAKEFLRKKNSKKKVKLNRSEFYCFTCKMARNAKRGSIRKIKNRKTAICRVCSGKMSRTI